MSTAELASPTIAPEKAGLLPWHEQPWRKLRPALEGGRLPHAWLLSGRDGLGKTRFAHALAQALLCHQNIAADERDNAQACRQCPACHQFMAGTHPDFMSLAVPEDKTIIRVNEMREFIQRLQLSSGYAQGRVGIVMQAEAMNASAANALLKTLEEPPANTWLFLVSAHPSRLPATIRSRCQFLGFCPPATDVASQWLEQQQPGAAQELVFAQGAPLLALQRLASEAGASRQRWEQQFDALARGRSDPISIADAWSGDDVESLLEWLYMRLLDGFRRRLQEGKDTQRLRELVDKVTESRRLLQTQSNVQMIMEDITLMMSPQNR